MPGRDKAFALLSGWHRLGAQDVSLLCLHSPTWETEGYSPCLGVTLKLLPSDAATQKSCFLLHRSPVFRDGLDTRFTHSPERQWLQTEPGVDFV